MLIALHVGQISFSQDYFKLLSVRKLIQVEMLYPGSVVPLAMFTFYVPAEVLNLTGASVTSNQQLVIILNDQWTNVPMDQWTKGPMDQWTDVPTDRWTNGPIDQRTDGPTDRWTNGLMDRWTNGAMDQRNDGPIDQWTRNSCDPMKRKTPWNVGHWKIGTFEHLNIRHSISTSLFYASPKSSCRS